MVVRVLFETRGVNDNPYLLRRYKLKVHISTSECLWANHKLEFAVLSG